MADLVIGVRAGFQPPRRYTPASANAAVSHTLDERWGVSPPWKACDSGVDLVSPAKHILRGWNHVRLLPAVNPAYGDLPLSGLLRTTWDALELFGKLELTGVDAIVPVERAGGSLWQRVAASVVRDRDRILDRPPIVLVQAGRAWPSSPQIRWDANAVLKTLSEIADVRQTLEPISMSDLTSTVDHPFGQSDDEPFRAQLTLSDWTIDDVGWLTEALSVACHRAGISQDIQLSVRLK